MVIKKTILSYLQEKGLTVQDKGSELITRCIFNKCDNDSHGSEAHLYFNAKTGQYQCKKCGAEWNMYAIMEHYWDDPKEENIDGYCKEPELEFLKPETKKATLTEKHIEAYHKAIPDTIRTYLNDRWIDDTIISERQLGYGTFYGKSRIVIPVRSADGALLFLKLRRDPASEDGPKYMFYPTWVSTALYGEENLLNNEDTIFICEGEFDQMMLKKNWILWVSSTAWASVFKVDWVAKLKTLKDVYLCFDNDTAGNAGADQLAWRIKNRYPHIAVHKISLPHDKGKDVSEYFLQGWTAEDLTTIYSEDILGVKPWEFPPMYTREIIEALSDTIKEDDTNKVLVFLACVSAFSDESQINVLLNAPSSSGKSFIPLEIAKYFPAESVMELQYVSQNAFFHEHGEYNAETNENHIDLSRKIIVFIDQPRSEVLARLRPLLSHDKKILVSKITDKNNKGGNRTKSIVIHWYPVTLFCTACPDLDEQEATRFLLLSPETTQKKLHAAISSKITYETNRQEARTKYSENKQRQELKKRLEHLRDAFIDDVIIEDTSLIEDVFFKEKQDLYPRDQRDVSRVMSLIKSFTLLNFADRRREGNMLYATQRDIEEGIALWKEVWPWQKYGVSPYIMDLYRTVFLPAYAEHNKTSQPFTPVSGINRSSVLKKHLQVKGRSISDAKWRQEIEPALENAWLIRKEMEWRSVLLFLIDDTANLSQF